MKKILFLICISTLSPLLAAERTVILDCTPHISKVGGNMIVGSSHERVKIVLNTEIVTVVSLIQENFQGKQTEYKTSQTNDNSLYQTQNGQNIYVFKMPGSCLKGVSISAVVTTRDTIASCAVISSDKFKGQDAEDCDE